MRIGKLWTLPELSECENVGSEYTLYRTVEGVEGVGFQVPMVDLEGVDADVRYKNISDIVQGVEVEQWLKIQLEVSPVPKIPSGHPSRLKAVKEVGGISKDLFFYFETNSQLGIFSKRKSSVNPPVDLLKSIGAKPLSQAETRSKFSFILSDKSADKNIDLGNEVVGVIRLKRSGTDYIDWHTLSFIQDELPKPFKISCTVRPISGAKTDLWLRSKLNRDQFSNDVTTADKLAATSSVLREVALNGVNVFEWEWILVLSRFSEETLRRDIDSAMRTLNRIGDPYVETFGGIPTFSASLPGTSPHVMQKEVFPTVLYYMPLATYGEGTLTVSESRTNCLLHRQDGSVHSFDLFNNRFLAFNTIVTGKTGSGKSVFGNALSRSLLNDPNIHLIKVDVGGSYKRECALYDGTEVNFHLDKASGVDPFRSISGKLTNEKLSVLTEFVATLALDEDETQVSKSIRGEIEKSLRAYFESRVSLGSLWEFIAMSENLPRKEILERFAENGVFENAIRSESSSHELNRYTYYNFENINGAANKDYAAGVMAAVIAFVNLEMIRLSQNEARSNGKRLVFFCDETKFFIEKNAAFFLLTTANFRKFGHAVILTGQNIEDFFLKRDGHIDRGLVLNSPTRIFFEAQNRPETLKEDFHLKDQHINAIGSGAYRGTDFRQFVLQDDLGTRICRLFLTSREYWEMTSTRSDVDKIEALKRSAPWLKENQIIEVMLLRDRTL